VSSAPQMRAHAPCLMVSNVTRAHDYYASRLGFRSPRMWGNPPTFCIAQRDGLELMLAEADPGKAVHPNSENDGRIDVYFWVNDADALHAEFTDNGAEVVCAPEDQVYGMREFLVRDPDGHVLAFGHDTTGTA
jgi:catechol 2,3-dioxygenase-like lactoylglutathione lyase family enzyme